MTVDSEDLDEHRDKYAQKTAEVRRRRLHGFQPNQTALRRREEELKEPVLTTPPETWPEAAAKARNLVQLFASASEAQDPASKELVACALVDLRRS
jgi:hypothetical protein